MIEQDGLWYRITHERPVDPDTGKRLVKGGKTVAQIIDATQFDPEHPDAAPVLATGESVCSEKDNFNRFLGRLIAMNRARFAYDGGRDAVRLAKSGGTPTV